MWAGYDKDLGQNRHRQWLVSWRHQAIAWTNFVLSSNLFYGIPLKVITQEMLLNLIRNIPDSKIHGANMGPTWGRQDPGGPHVGPMNLVIWDVFGVYTSQGTTSWYA